MGLPRLKVGLAVLGLILLSSSACASEYCTKEQYERDHALIADAFSNGTLANGPKGLRNSILIDDGEWYKMNYLQQIAFMQSFECSLGRGKKEFLYMDERSLATGKLLATWTLGVLKPADGTPDSSNPGTTAPLQGETRIGLTGRARTDFIKYAIEGCRSKSASPTFCSCYANALADSLSVEELKETSAGGNREAAVNTFRPKLEAATKRCVH